jgi:uncharacterized protein YutE (UPF0331/DUF86 family)
MVLIAEDLRRLEALAAKGRDEYLASEIDETLAERYLERMIGRMIDVNYHVLTESGEAPPRDYFESFVALSRIGALPADFAARLAPCAGLRNRIVHATTISTRDASTTPWPGSVDVPISRRSASSGDLRLISSGRSASVTASDGQLSARTARRNASETARGRAARAQRPAGGSEAGG